MERYTLQKYIAIVFLVFIIPLVYSIKSLGAVTTSSVYFEPGTSALPTDQILSLKINSDTSSVGFVRVSFAFDKNKINLSGEITKANPFDTEIEKTSMADANSLGAARIVLALPPAKSNEAPSGIFEVAQIPLHVVSPTQNDSTVFIFNKDDIQIIDMQSNPLSFDIVNPAYTLNFQETLTPTDTMTPTPTLLITNTVTPTPTTPSLTNPTNSPTVTLTPSPINSPTATLPPTNSVSPTSTPTITQTPIQSVSPTETPTPTQSVTMSPTQTPAPSLTPKPTHGRRFEWASHFWQMCKERFSSLFSRR